VTSRARLQRTGAEHLAYCATVVILDSLLRRPDGRLIAACGLLVLVGCTPAQEILVVTGGSTGGGEPSATSSNSSPITASTIDPSDSLSASATQGGGDSSNTDDGDTGDTGDTTGGVTTAVDTGADTSATSAETGMDTDTTTGMGGGTTTTGMGESSSEGGSSSSSDGGESSSSSDGGESSSSSDGGGESTDGTTGNGCGGIGNYDACLDAMGDPNSLLCGFPGSTCINGGTPPTVSVCSQTVCVDDCDCPQAPPGGNAAVTCGDLVGTPTPECYLDCSGGETCPTDMDCYAGALCVHAEEVEGWGSCVDSGSCGVNDTCIVDDPMMVTLGVCSTEDCSGPADCPAAPATGTAPVTCGSVVAAPPDECYLDCSGGQTCPDGMDCAFNFLCMWPQP